MDTAIVQFILDLPDLQTYYHIDSSPERVPISVVSEEESWSGDTPFKFGHPVRMMRTAPEGPHFILQEIQGDDNSVKITFQYPPEGIVGWAALEKLNGSWTVTDSEVSER